MAVRLPGGDDVAGRVDRGGIFDAARVAYGAYRRARCRILKQLTPRDHGALPQNGYREKSYPSSTISSSRNGASNVTKYDEC